MAQFVSTQLLSNLELCYPPKPPTIHCNQAGTRYQLTRIQRETVLLNLTVRREQPASFHPASYIIPPSTLSIAHSRPIAAETSRASSPYPLDKTSTPTRHMKPNHSPHTFDKTLWSLHAQDEPFSASDPLVPLLLTPLAEQARHGDPMSLRAACASPRVWD